MSNLYNMIEDALTKKGLSIPSDSFVFKKDYTPEEDSLDKSDIKDDIYNKNQKIEDNDLKLKEDEENEDAFIQHFMPIYDKYRENKLKWYDEQIEKAQEEYEKLNKEIGNSAEFADRKALRDIINEKMYYKNTQLGFLNFDRIIFKNWLNNIYKNFSPDVAYRILSYDPDKLMEIYDKTKPTFIEKRVEVLDTSNKKAFDITGAGSGEKKPKVKSEDEKTKITYEYDPNYKFSKEDVIKATNDPALQKDYDKIEYPYDIGTIRELPYRTNTDIISVTANKNEVERVLNANGVDTDFIYGAFDFDDEHDNPVRKCTLGGVPANQKEQNPLKFVYLQPWEPRYDEQESDVYRKASKYIKAPINMVKKQLVGQEPEHLNGMPFDFENKGEYWPLTDEQVEKVLLQGMMDYDNNMLSDDIFSIDLIDIFRKTPGAKVIKDALKAFDPQKRVILKYYPNKGYYIFIPYVDSNNRIKVNSNPWLRTYNKATGQ